MHILQFHSKAKQLSLQAKYLLATNFPAMEKNFREGGQIGMDPAVAKKTGSKGWMKRQKIVLDVAKCDEGNYSRSSRTFFDRVMPTACD